MIANNAVSIVELAVGNVRGILKSADARELDELSWNSDLARRLSSSIFAAFPHSSIELDARCAELLLAVSNMCQDKAGDYLDIGLAISAKALFRRAFETDSDAPHDTLVKADVLLACIREAWIEDRFDLVCHISKLRTLVAQVVGGRGNAPAHPPGPRYRRSTPDRTILELVTGNSSMQDQPSGHMNPQA